MIDISRKVPRFNFSFRISTNQIHGKGVNISQKGLGFLTEEEIVPAEQVSFQASVEGFIFSKKIYTIQGVGSLLYSTCSEKHGELYYNGFEFVSLDPAGQDSLLALLDDMRRFQRDPASTTEGKTLADFVHYPSDDILGKTELFYDTMGQKITNDLEMFSHYLASPSASTARLVHRHTDQAKDMIMLGSNNYLGLTTHPDVISAGTDALKTYGSGNGAGAMVGGTLSIHKELEEELADFVGKEAVMLFNSGYSANVGVISGLLRPHDAVVNDQLNHASIFDGCALSGARTLLFSHNNPSSLERTLKRAKLKHNGLMVVVDGVYSSDGLAAPLPEIAALAKKYGARLMVDEAHALGVLGQRGSGASEFFGLADRVDIVLGTMSKSLAGVGGFVAASKEAINYLRYYARSYLFSTGIPPACAASVLAALRVVRQDPGLRQKLRDNVEFLKSRLAGIGLDIGDPQAAIVPVFIADVNLLLKVSNRLFQSGVFHNVMTYPAVPMGGSLLRFGVMASHSVAELEEAARAIEEAVVGERLLEYCQGQEKRQSDRH